LSAQDPEFCHSRLTIASKRAIGRRWLIVNNPLNHRSSIPQAKNKSGIQFFKADSIAAGSRSYNYLSLHAAVDKPIRP
jgi:hypothetical protein